MILIFYLVILIFYTMILISCEMILIFDLDHFSSDLFYLWAHGPRQEAALVAALLHQRLRFRINPAPLIYKLILEAHFWDYALQYRFLLT